MAGGFQTGAPELIQAAQKMEQANANLQQNLAQLASEVEAVQSSWAGEASAAFQTLMQHFQDDAQKLNKNLNAIAEAVTANAKAYQQQEQEAQQSISQITSTLGG